MSRYTLVIALWLSVPIAASAQHIADTKTSLDARLHRSTQIHPHEDAWDIRYDGVKEFGILGELRVSLDSLERARALFWSDRVHGVKRTAVRKAVATLQKRLGTPHYEQLNAMEFWKWEAGGVNYLLAYGYNSVSYQETNAEFEAVVARLPKQKLR